ncbi:MAG TPA: SDR family NAD(P)-dependent oxidoreductase [Candidatus Limnocylindrales bacterium]
MTEPTAIDALVARLAPTLRGLLGDGRALPRLWFAEGGQPKPGESTLLLSPADTDDPVSAVGAHRGRTGAAPEQVVVPGAGTFRVDATRPSGRMGGRVALVTGAAQGFGLAIAEGLVAQGAFVVLADLNTGLAEANAGRLASEHGEGRAVAIPIDVTDETSVAAAMASILRRFGGLDLVVSNAGVLRAASVTTQPVADFDLVTRVNYRGYFLVVKHAAPVMARQHAANPAWWGDIIEINSKSGLQGSSRNSAYAGSKFGGIGLTQSFALELVGDGIKVNAICPGNFLDGPLWSDPQNGLFVQYLREGKVPGATTVDDVRHAYEAKVPMGRGCTPDDVLEALHYLVAQQYETGQALPVTGGQVMLS